MKKAVISTLGVIATVMISSNAYADEYEPQKIIDYRQDTMEAIKGHNSAIKAILEGKVPFDDQLGVHMSSLESLLETVGMLFPEGSDFGETNAKDAVWDNPDKFANTVKDAQQAFSEFKAVADKGDKKASLAAFKKFGKDSCGSCHKSFKKKDD
jgi:cytochrome c556